MTNNNQQQQPQNTVQPWDMFARPSGNQNNSQRGPALAPPGSRNLVEFRAGKLYRDSARSELIRADPRKGTLYLHQSEDGLMHVCWKDRKNIGGQVEEDLIVFPEEAEWLPVPQCTTGRVFVLKFKTSAQRLFFWMQEPKADKDADYAKKINQLLNHPPVPGQSPGGGATGAGGLLDNMTGDQEQLMRLLAAQGLIPEDALASLTGEGGAEPSSSTEQSSLGSALTPEILAPIVADDRLRQRLFPFMPENHERTTESLREVIASQPFKDAIQQLNGALQSGEMGPLIQELGLDPSIAQAPGDRVLAFLRAIRDKKRQSSGNDDQMDES